MPRCEPTVISAQIRNMGKKVNPMLPQAPGIMVKKFSRKQTLEGHKQKHPTDKGNQQFTDALYHKLPERPSLQREPRAHAR